MNVALNTSIDKGTGRDTVVTRTRVRLYDPVLMRFTTIDPLAEKYYPTSPYAYCQNDPMSYIDLNGEEPTKAEAAAMAAHVYGDKSASVLIGGWRISHANLGVTSNDLNGKYGLKSCIYERVDRCGQVQEYAYVTAGTEDVIDCVHDALQTKGLSLQYKQSVENAEKISSLCKKELTFIGHSLGGGEAALNAMATGRKAITFNAAGVSNFTKAANAKISSIFKNFKSLIKAYIMTTDPLNALQNSPSLIGRYLPDVDGQRIYVNPTTKKGILNGHSIDNFLDAFGVNY